MFGHTRRPMLGGFLPLWETRVTPEGELVVTMELPGVGPDDVEVAAVGEVLTIKDRPFGVYERRFRLPEGVDSTRISARFEPPAVIVTVPAAAVPKHTVVVLPARAA